MIRRIRKTIQQVDRGRKKRSDSRTKEIYRSLCMPTNEDLIAERGVSRLRVRRRSAGNRQPLFGQISIHSPPIEVIFRGTLIFRSSTTRPVKLP